MIASHSFTSSIGLIIASYIAHNQFLGKKCTSELSILRNLDIFLTSRQSNLTAKAFEKWLYTKRHVSCSFIHQHVRIVHNFCLYQRRTKPLCFVPDLLLFPKGNKPIQAFIFKKYDIVRLLDAIKQLKPGSRSPLRKENFRIALVLLYTK